MLDFTGNGAVREGTEPKAPTKLRIDDADLVALTKDPAAVRDFYQRGKLRVDGDVRPAHKLGFLKDLALRPPSPSEWRVGRSPPFRWDRDAPTRMECSMGRRVNVIGVGMTKFAKPGQSEDYHVMASKAAQAALEDAKVPYARSSRRTPGTSTATARAASARCTRWASPASPSST